MSDDIINFYKNASGEEPVKEEIGYNQVIPYHHEVIKNLLKRIEELEATVAELKK
jgi:hypothetical protein